MLQDLVYTDGAIIPELDGSRKIENQIKYLEDNKANCVNIRGCNPNGYTTFCIDDSGNETISGVRNLSTPIYGFTNVESLLSDLAADGGGNLATKVLVHSSNNSGYISVLPPGDNEYKDVCYSTSIYTDGTNLAVGGNVSATNGSFSCISANSVSLTGDLSVSNIDASASVSSPSVCATSCVVTPKVCSSVSVEICANGTTFIVDCSGAWITCGRFYAPELCGNSVHATDAYFTNVYTNSISIDFLSYDGTCNNLIMGDNCITTTCCYYDNVVIGKDFNFTADCCFNRNYIANTKVTGCPIQCYVGSVLVNSCLNSNISKSFVGKTFINQNYVRESVISGSGEITSEKISGVGNFAEWVICGSDYYGCDLYNEIVNHSDISAGGTENVNYDYSVLGYIYYSDDDSGIFWDKCAIKSISHCYGYGNNNAKITINTVDGCTLFIDKSDSNIPTQRRVAIQYMMLERNI